MPEALMLQAFYYKDDSNRNSYCRSIKQMYHLLDLCRNLDSIYLLVNPPSMTRSVPVIVSAASLTR